MDLKHFLIVIALITVIYVNYAHSVTEGRKLTDEQLDETVECLLCPHTTAAHEHIIYEHLNGTKNEGSLCQKMFVKDMEVQEHTNRDHPEKDSGEKQEQHQTLRKKKKTQEEEKRLKRKEKEEEQWERKEEEERQQKKREEEQQHKRNNELGNQQGKEEEKRPLKISEEERQWKRRENKEEQWKRKEELEELQRRKEEEERQQKKREEVRQQKSRDDEEEQRQRKKELEEKQRRKQDDDRQWKGREEEEKQQKRKEERIEQRREEENEWQEKIEEQARKLTSDDVDEPVQKQNGEFEPSQLAVNSTCRADMESLRGHIFNIQLNDTENKCSQCAKTFGNAMELEEHENTVHAEEDSWEEEEQNSAEQFCPLCNIFGSDKYEELAKHTEKCLSSEDQKSNNDARKKQTKQITVDDVSQDKNVVVDNEPVEKLSGHFDLSNFEHSIDDEETRIPAVINRIKSRLKHSEAVNMITASYFCTMEVDFYSYNSIDQGWGCGYKNFQMLLSAMLRTKKYGSIVRRHFKKFGVEVRTVVPSILTIRKSIEFAWSLGFDPQGKRLLEGKDLSANDKWIGITEVKAVLATMRIRTELIDSLTVNNKGYHENMTNHIEEYFKSDETVKLPILFQEFGHSKSIVGIEVREGGGIIFMVLDPDVHENKIFNMGEVEYTLSEIRTDVNQFSGHLYQVLKVIGIMEFEEEYEDSKPTFPDKGF